MCHFFLIFAPSSANVVYNAVSVDHTSWQIAKAFNIDYLIDFGRILVNGMHIVKRHFHKKEKNG